MEIKSKSVKVFCAVVESGSLLSASNKLSLSASAASRVISQLEDRLGFDLFDRSNKTLTLTEEGKEFYRMAMESLRVWKILEDFPNHKKTHKRSLRIAVLARHCSDVILPAVVKTLKKNQDRISVTLDIHQSRDIYYSKYSHPFDVGFGTLLSDHDDLQKVALAHLPFRLVVSRLNPLFDKPVVSASDYAHESFIVLSNDTKERHHCDRLLPRQLSPDQIVAEVSSTQVALRMVARNAGVHLTDLLATISVSKDCTAIPLDDPMTIPFYVFWPKNGSLTKEIIECIAEISRSIQNAGIPLTQEGLNFIQSHESTNDRPLSRSLTISN